MPAEHTLLDLLLAATPEQLDRVYAVLRDVPVTPDPEPSPLVETPEKDPESPQDTDTLLGTTMVTVYGPNLSSKAQRIGYFHVHATGCGHGKQYGTGRPMGGDDDGGWTIDAATREDVVRAIYSDHMAEQPDEPWQAFDDLYIAPCAKQLDD